MTTYTTQPGDVIDEILSLHYGPDRLSDALLVALAENPGLAAHGLSLPGGLTIRLPALPDRTDAGGVQLWS